MLKGGLTVGRTFIMPPLIAMPWITLQSVDPMASRTVSTVASHPRTTTPSNFAARAASCRRRLDVYMNATKWCGSLLSKMAVLIPSASRRLFSARMNDS